MYDAGSWDRRERRSMAQKAVQQGAAPIATARVNDQTGRFVDDEHNVILEHNRQWDRLGRVLGGRRRRLWRNHHDLTSPDLGFCGGRTSIQRNVSGSHPFLEPVARVFGYQPGQRLIKPQAGAIARNSNATERVTREVFYIIRQTFYGFGHET